MVNLALVVYLVVTKWLFGVRGGKRAYEERLREGAILEQAAEAARMVEGGAQAADEGVARAGEVVEAGEVTETGGAAEREGAGASGTDGAGEAVDEVSGVSGGGIHQREELYVWEHVQVFKIMVLSCR